MAVLPIILRDKQIVLSQDVTDVGISFDSAIFQCAEVIDKSDLCEFVNIGDVIFYNTNGSQRFTYNDSLYFLSTEDNVVIKEDNT